MLYMAVWPQLETIGHTAIHAHHGQQGWNCLSEMERQATNCSKCWRHATHDSPFSSNSPTLPRKFVILLLSCWILHLLDVFSATGKLFFFNRTLSALDLSLLAVCLYWKVTPAVGYRPLVQANAVSRLSCMWSTKMAALLLRFYLCSSEAAKAENSCVLSLNTNFPCSSWLVPAIPEAKCRGSLQPSVSRRTSFPSPNPQYLLAFSSSWSGSGNTEHSWDRRPLSPMCYIWTQQRRSW